MQFVIFFRGVDMSVERIAVSLEPGLLSKLETP